jgi:hypothetical protein
MIFWSLGTDPCQLEPVNATKESVESSGILLVSYEVPRISSPGASTTNDPALDPHRISEDTDSHHSWDTTFCNRDGMMQICTSRNYLKSLNI